MRRLLPLCLAFCAACVTTKQEGDEMRKRIDALEKDAKAQKEATAADRQSVV